MMKTKELLLRIVKQVKKRGYLNIKKLAQDLQAEGLFKDSKDFHNAYVSLKRRGYLEVIKPQSTKSLIRITDKGLEIVIFYKILNNLRRHKKWDGYWRFVIFDIPEEVNDLRDNLRNLLKRLGFKMLQASVWIYPFDVFKELEKLIPDIKQHGWIKLLVAKEVTGIGQRELRKEFKVN